MDILNKKFKISSINKFEKDLNKLLKFDNILREELKEELEYPTRIVMHKPTYYNRRRINPVLINKNEILKFIKHLQDILSYEVLIKKDFKSISKKFKKVVLDDYDSRLFSFITQNLGYLFHAIKNAYINSKTIEEILSEIEPEEQHNFHDDFSNLNTDLEHIRSFLMELQHYSDFLKKRTIEKPYIDAKKVKKRDSYLNDLKKYKHIRKKIIETEIKIETNPHFVKNLHELIKYGGLNGKLHARINNNLRIYYEWDNKNKNLNYLYILTKNEFDKI